MKFIQKQAVTMCLLSSFASGTAMANEAFSDVVIDVPPVEGAVSWLTCALSKTQSAFEAGLLVVEADKFFRLIDSGNEEYKYTVFPVPEDCYGPNRPKLF